MKWVIPCHELDSLEKVNLSLRYVSSYYTYNVMVNMYNVTRRCPAHTNYDCRVFEA